MFFPGLENATMTAILTLRKEVGPKSRRAKAKSVKIMKLRSVQQRDWERRWRFPHPIPHSLVELTRLHPPELPRVRTLSYIL